MSFSFSSFLLIFLCLQNQVFGALNSCPITISSCKSEAESKFQSISCTCYTCKEANGLINYSCSYPNSTKCAGSYSSSTGNNNISGEANDYSNKDVALICGPFVAVCIVFFLFAKIKGSKGDNPRDEAFKNSMNFVKKLIWGEVSAILKEDQKNIRGIAEFTISENECLNTFRCNCYPKPESLSPFTIRFLALLTGILLTSALGVLFGTVSLNDSACSTTTTIDYCSIPATEGTCIATCNGISAACSVSSIGLCQLKNACNGGSTCTSTVEGNVGSTRRSSNTASTCDGLNIVDLDNSYSYVVAALGFLFSFCTSRFRKLSGAGIFSQLFYHSIPLVSSVALLIYSISYSSEKFATSNQSPPDYRNKVIIAVTIYGWLKEQFGNLLSKPVHFILAKIAYETLFRSSNESFVFPYTAESGKPTTVQMDYLK